MDLHWDGLGDTTHPMNVELSWNINTDGSAASNKNLAWETAPKMVSGTRVRKKNLPPGGTCRFRLRCGLESTPCTAKGQCAINFKYDFGKKALRATDSRGPWCKAIKVNLPASLSSTSATEPKGWTKKTEYTVKSTPPLQFSKILSRPCGLHATAIDPTTAELRWSLPSPRNAKQKMYVELGWCCKASPPGSGLQHDMWVTAPALVKGERVLKKNLVPGAMYHFRVRYAHPDSRASDPGTYSVCNFGHDIILTF